ncbi:MAG: hypothetical protein NUW01_02310 [Gemmatimonadaceae bacterium]|nr:hypothetical protein [Gemmatimonadaceae bacterium]
MTEGLHEKIAEQDARIRELEAALEGLLGLNVFRADDPRDEIVAARAALDPKGDA